MRYLLVDFILVGGLFGLARAALAANRRWLSSLAMTVALFYAFFAAFRAWNDFAETFAEAPAFVIAAILAAIIFFRMYAPTIAQMADELQKRIQGSTRSAITQADTTLKKNELSIAESGTLKSKTVAVRPASSPRPPFGPSIALIGLALLWTVGGAAWLMYGPTLLATPDLKPQETPFYLLKPAEKPACYEFYFKTIGNDRIPRYSEQDQCGWDAKK